MPNFDSENSGSTRNVSMTDLTMKSLKANEPSIITIIGSGDFGRGLAKRMVQCGYTVYMGSRNPTGNTK